MFQERLDLLLRQFLLHLHHPYIRGRDPAVVEQHVLCHRDTEMLMFPKGGHDRSVTCQAGSEGDGPAVGELRQVNILL